MITRSFNLSGMPVRTAGLALRFVFSAGAGAGPYAYVANSGELSYNDNTISVIDTANNTVVAAIPAGMHTDFRAVAMNPGATRVYVSDHYNNDISVINATNNQVITSIPVDSGPTGIAVDNTGQHVYMVNPGDSRICIADNGNNQVAVIDAGNNNILASVNVGTAPLSVGQFMQGGAILANGFEASPK
ncbi:hypothetical protein [Dokdonella soli]|uniref:YncE family protein n=1 Tax=Dokdonella soli TaxID=529810 RepID=A0ABN1ICM8_9GAMM